MTQWIPFYGVAYGSVASLFALVWHLAVAYGYPLVPEATWVDDLILVLHGCTIVLTLHKTIWPPVVRITAKRVKVAQLLLILAVVNFLICFGLTLIAPVINNDALATRVVPLTATSLMLATTVYVGLHWAFRPENLFSASFIDMFKPRVPFMRRKNHDDDYD
jgi:hypothetical protein